MKLKCENPVIIFNPNIRWLLSTKIRKIVYPLGSYDYHTMHNRFYDVPWRDLYALKEMCTLDNLDSFVMLDEDGVCYPVFMAVPCGKCRLCRSKYIEDWCTRCMCESSSSDYPPLFLTLTFRPDVRPATSDECKRALQLFLKRLRIHVSRNLKLPNRELRYMFRSEKTPKNHYFHFHGLLWNMPFIAQNEGDRHSFQSLIKFIQDAWSYGFVKVERCRDYSGAYCMKYVSKDDDDDCFMLSSRRNGIGYSFAMQLLPTVMKNPDITSISIPVNGKVVTRPIPSYFKRLWFPTLSNLFSAKICLALRTFAESSVKVGYALWHIYPNGCNALDKLAGMQRLIAEKYDITHIDFEDCRPKKEYRNIVDKFIQLKTNYSRLIDFRRGAYECKCHLSEDGFLIPYRHYQLSPGSEFIVSVPLSQSEIIAKNTCLINFRQSLIREYRSCLDAYMTLYNYNFDRDDFIRRLSIAQLHKDYLSIADHPDYDIDSLVSLYESDQNWIETHWKQTEIG